MRSDLPLPEPARLEAEIESLALIREPDSPGWTRRALSEEETAGRHEVERRMRAALVDAQLRGALGPGVGACRLVAEASGSLRAALSRQPVAL